MPRTHYLSGEDVHYKWDVSNEPLIVIDPADTVVVRRAASSACCAPVGARRGVLPFV
jgi:hypothetical protein